MTDDLQVEYVSIDALTLDPRNARKHNDRNIQSIATSLKEFGQRRPLIVTSDNVVVAGNGTLQAAKTLGWTQVAVTRFPSDDPVKVRAYAIADNRTAELAEWDEAVLLETLSDLDVAGMLEYTGFTEADIKQYEDALGGDDAEGEGVFAADEGEQGSLLKLTDVTVGEPKHQVSRHDIYQLKMPNDVSHVLVVAHVMKEWALYVDYLHDNAILVPYPDPYITATRTALDHPLVLVQSDEYLAGHVLDKHAAAFGENSVVRIP